ncbi:hypothetical protein ANCCAN_23401 [Ancylostoma caninum]|uniref:Rab3 GTPase-activating protein catalytic subunit n=1 Tax=Ancylostoma caninum TaxID=29170 RepID=A0A368FGY9_ANCCA|nr:hypothetical protein ANCCAN_23401 [Ancylostoma caninum]
MEKEGEEEEVFEIDDFTVITEFERFVVAIEALVQEWGLIGTRPRKKYPKGALRVCAWQSKSSTVNFGESNKLKVTYYYPDLPSDVIEEVPCSENDGHISSFGFDIAYAETDFIYHSNITTMYGVSEFIVMSPADQVDDAIMTEDQKNLVISAFRVAQHSVVCEIPMFIQFGHIDRQLFFGTSCNKSVVTHYGGSHLRKGQLRHTHLSGLLEVFKEHVKCPISLLDADDIRVSVQFDYNVKFPSYPSKYIDDSCEILECHTLPFGSRDEPISEFNVIAIWPNMKEEMINENEYHSDLDLLSAFNWAGSVQFQYTEGLLDYALSRIIDLPQSKEASETAFSLLGLRSSPKAFGQLTDGGIQNIRIAGVSNFSITNPGGLALDEVLMPISKSVMKRCMDKIFDVDDTEEDASMEITPNQSLISTPGSAVRSSPDPSVSHPHSDLRKFDTQLGETGQSERNDDSKVNSVLRQSKWTPPGSLTRRFAMAFTNAALDFVFGPCAFAQVWYEFVNRLRTYYDSTKDLPGMSEVTQPNLSHCLLHQKMEMLQCCITAKRRRHELYDNTKDFGTDEFFDAQSEQSGDDSSEGESKKEVSTFSSSQSSFKSGKSHANFEPSGRLHPFGEMRLLKHKDTLLYVPITQDRSPMTEDMVDEYARYLSSLDDGDARVQAQLDVLCSDMQAFKAANPKCCLEDFIRWHSPKDWIEEEECLSERMQLPDNTWVKCWNEAMPVPVINQARLFNESKIAEEILSLLENATVQQMVDFLRPVIFTSAVQQITEKAKCIGNLLDGEQLARSVHRANRSGLRQEFLLLAMINDSDLNAQLMFYRDDYVDALKQLKSAELLFVQYTSLLNKLSFATSDDSVIEEPNADELYKFIICLIEDATTKREAVDRNVISRGVPIFGASSGALGNAVRRMLERQDVTNGRLPPPTRKQYTLRWSVPRPTANSRVVPQRMFASIEQEEFRLCGAFTEDTVYT